MTSDSSIEVPPKKKRGVMWWIGGAFLLLLVLFLWQLFGPSPRIIVSRETTYITAPLKPNGLPDYGRYLLEKSREGVTPENNAAVLLWQALWPGDLEPQHYALMAKELGLAAIPSADDSLQPLHSQKNRERVAAWLYPDNAADDEVEADPVPWYMDPRQEAVEPVLDAAMYRSWTSAQIPPLGEWIEENQGPLDLIVEAAQRPHYWSPSPNLIDGSDPLLFAWMVPDLQGIRDAARSLPARAMWNLGEGRPMEAWRDLLAMHRLARLVAQGNTLTEQLFATTIDSIANDATVTLLGNAELTPDQARQMLRDLAGLSDFSLVAQSIDEEERFTLLDAVCVASKDGLQVLYEIQFLYTSLQDVFDGKTPEQSFHPLTKTSIDWNVVLRDGNDWFDRLQAAAELPDRAARNTALAKLKADLKQMQTDVSRPTERFGGLLSRRQRSHMVAALALRLLLPATDENLNSQDRANTRLAMERLAAALAVYRAEHGEYPEKLDDLVFEVVSQLPVDLYSTKPFVYRRDGEGYLLYSVGENGKDDGGSNRLWNGGVFEGRLLDELPDDEADELHEQITYDADDIAIRVPVAPLQITPPPRTTPQ